MASEQSIRHYHSYHLPAYGDDPENTTPDPFAVQQATQIYSNLGVEFNLKQPGRKPHVFYDVVHGSYPASVMQHPSSPRAIAITEVFEVLSVFYSKWQTLISIPSDFPPASRHLSNPSQVEASRRYNRDQRLGRRRYSAP